MNWFSGLNVVLLGAGAPFVWSTRPVNVGGFSMVDSGFLVYPTSLSLSGSKEFIDFPLVMVDFFC